jgi:hypothetical protein
LPGASHKLFQRLGIGDGAFPKCANKRQKAPCRGKFHGGNRSANEKPFAEYYSTRHRSAEFALLLVLE